MNKNEKKKYIVLNKKIYHNFFIQKNIEAGIILQGWEVKSLRLGNVTINNSYVNILPNGKIYLLNTKITPLITHCSHVKYICDRNKELLLHKKEIEFLQTYIKNKSFTIVVIGLYWKKSFCKANIAIAKGKKNFDKRNLLKLKEWNINKLRIKKYK
ncbi:SsrA-binding protein SmpB [Enterobacteriaceae endosymbiont of Neohaemonia nigricornis]|uniref:SsrA-binding protein SmpB n=1 Tax=Enterobacteriaceae endosymbiont of Neohaemonia nigricornis TaxID=2675792 RepID=UPI001448D27A|nr:SsrA-binding protein SmpB [Enterobacteriaceae endosymbiont of Neohaemonia nigricornis]